MRTHARGQRGFTLAEMMMFLVIVLVYATITYSVGRWVASLHPHFSFLKLLGMYAVQQGIGAAIGDSGPGRLASWGILLTVFGVDGWKPFLRVSEDAPKPAAVAAAQPTSEPAAAVPAAAAPATAPAPVAAPAAPASNDETPERIVGTYTLADADKHCGAKAKMTLSKHHFEVSDCKASADNVLLKIEKVEADGDIYTFKIAGDMPINLRADGTQLSIPGSARWPGKWRKANP